MIVYRFFVWAVINFDPVPSYWRLELVHKLRSVAIDERFK